MSVKVVTVGAGGYATTYVHPLLDDMHKGNYEYAGIIERDMSRCPFTERIKEENIPVFESLDEYFKKGNKADLVIIAIPTHFHKYNSIIAVEHGADVLCEKPAAPLYADVLEMIDAAEKNDKFIGIGYQWSYSEAMRSLKADILAGKLGKAIELKSFISWPRPHEYYNGTWKGKIKDSDDNFILDSVVNNAAAHYLHNMYYLLGDAVDTCDYPKNIRCELLRANEIENFDTCLLDIETKSGAKLIYTASHITDRNESPKLHFKFEKCTVTFNMGGEGDHVIAKFDDGTVKDYGNPGDRLNTRMWEAIDAVTTRKPLVCTVKTAAAHTLTVNELYEKGKITEFPDELITVDGNQTVVKGFYELMFEAFEKGCLLSDIDVSWIKAQKFTVNK